MIYILYYVVKKLIKSMSKLGPIGKLLQLILMWL